MVAIAAAVILCTFAGTPSSVAGQSDAVSDEIVSALDSLLNVRVNAAARYEQEVRWAPASLTIISSDQITIRGYTTLADVLNDVPGFYITYDRDYSFIGIRGFGRPTDWNNRVLVLLNGHRLNEGVYFSIPSGRELEQNLLGVERIEIIRGPGGALYGTSAMFAVINLVTRSGEEIDGGRVNVEGGSFGARTLSFVAGRKFESGLDLSVSGEGGRIDGQDLYFAEFDEGSTNDGIASDLDWEEFTKITADVSIGGLSLTGRLGIREKGIPTAAWETTFNDPRSQVESRWGGAELRYSSRLSPTAEILLSGAFDTYRFQGTYPREVELLQNSSDASGIGGGVQLNLDLSPAHRVTIGSEVTRYFRADYLDRIDGGSPVGSDHPYTVSSVFGQIEAHIASGVAVTAGLRHDDYTYASSSLTPRLALIATPNRGTVVKFLWGTAFRAPNIYEQYVVNAPLERPALEAETIETWEVTGERRVGENLLLQASLYRYDVTGLIEVDEDLDNGTWWYTNRGAVQTFGAESSIVYRFGDIRTSLSYGFARAEDQGTGDPLSNSPRHLLKGYAWVPLPGSIEATWTQRVESGRLTVRGTRTDGFAVSTLTLRRRGLFGSGDLHLMVGNLFDTEYSTPGGFEHRQGSIPQDGRTVSLRAVWKF